MTTVTATNEAKNATLSRHFYPFFCSQLLRWLVGRSVDVSVCFYLILYLFLPLPLRLFERINNNYNCHQSIYLSVCVCVCEREQENARTFAGVAFVNEIVLLPPPHFSKMCVARNNHCIHQCTQNTAKESLCDEFYDIMFK